MHTHAHAHAHQAFTEKVVEECATDADYVWIHDYHLLVMPSLLRKRFNKIRCARAAKSDARMNFNRVRACPRSRASDCTRSGVRTPPRRPCRRRGRRASRDFTWPCTHTLGRSSTRLLTHSVTHSLAHSPPCSTPRCGVFLHSPFPSSEIFRTFPKRDELLRSMLNADLIGELAQRTQHATQAPARLHPARHPPSGRRTPPPTRFLKPCLVPLPHAPCFLPPPPTTTGFHTFDYARHFLSCCSRMLGLEHQTTRGSISVEYYGRNVGIKIMPTGEQERLRFDELN